MSKGQIELLVYLCIAVAALLFAISLLIREMVGAGIVFGVIALLIGYVAIARRDRTHS